MSDSSTQSWYDYIKQAGGDWANSASNFVTDWSVPWTQKVGQLVGLNPTIRIAQAIGAPISDSLGSNFFGITNARDVFQVATGNAAPGISLSSTIFDGIANVPNYNPSDKAAYARAASNALPDSAQSPSDSLPLWGKAVIILACVAGTVFVIKGVMN